MRDTHWRYDGRMHYRIPDEATEAVADALLASVPADEERPAYTERQLARRDQRCQSAEEYFIQLAAERCARDDQDTHAILAKLEMPAIQRKVWELFESGLRASEVARSLRITRPTAMRLLRETAHRIASCMSTYQALDSVYHREVHRYVYREPSHCQAQPCRFLKYCRYAGPR